MPRQRCRQSLTDLPDLPDLPDADPTNEGIDTPLDPDRPERPDRGGETSPWLREGADAPDAADIAEPDEQR